MADESGQDFPGDAAPVAVPGDALAEGQVVGRPAHRFTGSPRSVATPEGFSGSLGGLCPQPVCMTGLNVSIDFQSCSGAGWKHTLAPLPSGDWGGLIPWLRGPAWTPRKRVSAVQMAFC